LSWNLLLLVRQSANIAGLAGGAVRHNPHYGVGGASTVKSQVEE